MINEMLTAPMAEHGEDDCDKAHCSKNFDKRGLSLIKDQRDGFDHARCQQSERIPCTQVAADRVHVNMEGGTTIAAQGALVQLKCKCRNVEPLRAEVMEALASAGEVADVKAASTFGTENSDPAANIGDLTMTVVVF